MPSFSLILLSILYFLTARFGMAVFALQPTNITLLWLPAGIGLIMVLIGKARALPLILTASFLANWSGMQLPDLWHSNLHTAIAAIADTLAAWIAASLLRKYFTHGLQRAADLFRFVFLVCFLPTLCSGIILVSNLVIGSYLPANHFFTLLAKMIAADSLGILLIYPLYADWRAGSEGKESFIDANIAPNFAYILIALGGVWLAFRQFPGAIYFFPAIALLLAYRAKASAVSFLLLTATVVLLSLSTKNLGPFAIANQDQAHLLLMSFIMFTTLATQSVSIQQRQLDLSIEQSQSWQQKAMHDNLTGLHNRAYFENILADEWQRYRKFHRTFVLAMLDIDHFKHINDVYGHAAGDEVLRTIAKVLPQSLRQIDIVCRYGGEEFTLLLPGTNLDEAKIILERLRAAIQNTPFVFGDQTLQVTVSIGAVIAKEDLHDHHEMLVRSDKQMYQAKAAGRNRVEI
ncbi:GGDEF domain-containing protein [Undibacterium flavidum]|uniref:diguanylate cyclase n=1 Tax=Undibacterium flavidum TaxID=2762297 RepID=A0ABR6YGN6_9BURK|nr:GGDEF domain-containing protein [Undibacterium flavidum]MBC3875750.1 diguanylate cyclase [Undibacterium flavidum]